MANIAIKKTTEASCQSLPLFQELESRLDQVQKRAFQLFETRGRELGHAFEDWVHAERDVLGWPAAELAEIDGRFQLEMTLPGFDEKQVEVAATPSEIVVHAEIKEERKPEAHVLWTEFGPNNVYRRFSLPEPIDVTQAKATLDHGLLKIVAAKAPAPEPKPVPLTGA